MNDDDQSPLLKMSSLAASYFAGVVGAGLDKLSQEERRRSGGARAFIPASGKFFNQNLDS